MSKSQFNKSAYIELRVNPPTAATDAAGVIRTMPVVRGDKVYVVSDDNKIYIWDTVAEQKSQNVTAVSLPAIDNIAEAECKFSSILPDQKLYLLITNLPIANYRYESFSTQYNYENRIYVLDEKSRSWQQLKNIDFFSTPCALIDDSYAACIQTRNSMTSLKTLALSENKSFEGSQWTDWSMPLPVVQSVSLTLHPLAPGLLLCDYLPGNDYSGLSVWENNNGRLSSKFGVTNLFNDEKGQGNTTSILPLLNMRAATIWTLSKKIKVNSTEYYLKSDFLAIYEIDITQRKINLLSSTQLHAPSTLLAFPDNKEKFICYSIKASRDVNQFTMFDVRNLVKSNSEVASYIYTMNSNLEIIGMLNNARIVCKNKANQDIGILDINALHQCYEMAIHSSNPNKLIPVICKMIIEFCGELNFPDKPIADQPTARSHSLFRPTWGGRNHNDLVMNWDKPNKSNIGVKCL